MKFAKFLGSTCLQQPVCSQGSRPLTTSKRSSLKAFQCRLFSIFPGKGVLDMATLRTKHQTPQTRHRSIETLFNPSNLKNIDFKKHLYHLLKDDAGKVPVTRFLKSFRRMGLWSSDPRLSEMMKEMGVHSKDNKFSSFSDGSLDQEEFARVVSCNPDLLKQVFTGDLIIPEFEQFCTVIERIYNNCKDRTEGKVPTYIPQLAKFDPKSWAVSVCTIDGQRFSMGDDKVPFTMQSAAKPLAYAVAVNESGTEEVHKYVGCEPSGESFNSIKLGADLRPHNPMINLGAIVISSMIKQNLGMGERFDYLQQQYSLMAGGDMVGFNNPVYLSEKSTANRNLALGYYLKEHNCFPPNTVLDDCLDLYFMNCSVEITANSGAVMASTLANGGYCPLTNEQVLSPSAVRNTLVLMHSCGMYHYSGNFSFKVGLPAKSSVSGCVLLIIPNVMGICLWSPPLDEIGNSVRGVNFCEELVSLFNFHHYDSLVRSDNKLDPRRQNIDSLSSNTANLLFAANRGDIKTLRSLALHGTDLGASDYDCRNALHVAAAEGHLDCVEFLVKRCQVEVASKDRWGRVPLDDAIQFQHQKVVDYLKSLDK